MTISNIFLIAATVCVGLMAGLFFSFSYSVMPGLGKLCDQQFLSSMQCINRAIQNPVFFTVFFGVLILLPVATYLKFTQPICIAWWFLSAATLTYFTGVFLVTALGNIPLNNVLDKFDIAAATKESISNQRLLFEARWNGLNLIRTIASLLSFIFLLLTLLLNYQKH